MKVTPNPNKPVAAAKPAPAGMAQAASPQPMLMNRPPALNGLGLGLGMYGWSRPTQPVSGPGFVGAPALDMDKAPDAMAETGLALMQQGMGPAFNPNIKKALGAMSDEQFQAMVQGIKARQRA